MKRLTCAVDSIEYFNKDTRKVFLKLPEPAPFKAGQYLEIILPQKKCPFSIASAPSVTDRIELHVRPTPASDDSVLIEQLLNTATQIDIELPKGDCFIEAKPGSTTILIAASTGITQMKSIIEHLLPGGLDHPIHLYWGVLRDSDLYLADLCESWVAANPNFHYTPVVSEPALSPHWRGRTGLVGEIALADFNQLDDATVIVSGGPGMVYATLDAFVAKGMPAANMKSDIFSYAPRAKTG